MNLQNALKILNDVEKHPEKKVAKAIAICEAEGVTPNKAKRKAAKKTAKKTAKRKAAKK